MAIQDYIDKIKIDRERKLSAIEHISYSYSKYLMLLKMKNLSEQEEKVGRSCFDWTDRELYDFISDSNYSNDMELTKGVLKEYFRIAKKKFSPLVDAVDFKNVIPSCVNDMGWTAKSIAGISDDYFILAKNEQDNQRIKNMFIAISLFYYYGAETKSEDIPNGIVKNIGGGFLVSNGDITFPVDERTAEVILTAFTIATEKNYTFNIYRDYWSHRAAEDSRYKMFSSYAIKWSGIYQRMLAFDKKNNNIILKGQCKRKVFESFGHPCIRNSYDYNKSVRRYAQWRKTFGYDF